MNDENLSANELEQLLGNTVDTADTTEKQNPPKLNLLQTSSSDSFKFIEDVSIRLTVELGRKKMSILETSKLKEGSILELDKNIGENLDLLANGKKVGEVRLIAMNDYYGFQIIDIVEPIETPKLNY